MLALKSVWERARSSVYAPASDTFSTAIISPPVNLICFFIIPSNRLYLSGLEERKVMSIPTEQEVL